MNASTDGFIPIPGWGQAYQIEPETGRVRSVDRTVCDIRGRVRHLRGIELAPQQSARGATVRVSLCVHGHRRTIPVARLAAAATAAANRNAVQPTTKREHQK